MIFTKKGDAAVLAKLSAAPAPYREIAERLHMSVATVKTHILNMLEKTGFRNRTELAVRARESGLVILNRKN